MLIELKHYLKN